MSGSTMVSVAMDDSILTFRPDGTGSDAPSVTEASCQQTGPQMAQTKTQMAQTKTQMGASTRLFVAIEAGALVRSDDGGWTWRDRVETGPIDTHTLVVHPHDPMRLYSAAGDGYFESGDGGLTWRKQEDGLRHRYAWSCVVDPVDPETILISSSAGPVAAHWAPRAESWIYRRTGGGRWRPVENGLPPAEGTTVSALAADPHDGGVFYAANNRGVFRSSDRGETWRQLEVAWPDRFRMQRVTGLAVARTR